MGVLQVLVLVFSILLVVFVASILLPTRVRFRGRYNQGKFCYEAQFRLPYIPWYIKFPDLTKHPSDNTKKAAGPKMPSLDLDAVRHGLETLRSLRPDIERVLREIAKAVAVDELEFDAVVGTEDAAESAILVGALRAGAGVALAVVQHSGVSFRKKPRIMIRPVFDGYQVSARAGATVSVTPLPVLFAAYRFYRRVKPPMRHKKIPARPDSAA